ncbi:MAG: hypothetical protein H6707_20410 [Deltaproteobacteria bacterium]|nr:hypothetical protein [Deltaproteobacteria bacterium]
MRYNRIATPALLALLLNSSACGMLPKSSRLPTFGKSERAAPPATQVHASSETTKATSATTSAPPATPLASAAAAGSADLSKLAHDYGKEVGAPSNIYRGFGYYVAFARQYQADKQAVFHKLQGGYQQYIDYFAESKGFIERCKSKYAPLFVDGAPGPALSSMAPEMQNACLWIEEANKTMTRALIDLATQDLRGDKKYADGIVKRIQAGKKVTHGELAVLVSGKSDGDVLYKRWQENFEKLGIPMPAALSSKTVDTSGAKKTLANATKKKRFPRCKPAPADYRASLNREFSEAGLKVIRVCVDGGWEIKKNALGIPVDRMRNTWVLARRANESFCRHYTGVGVFQKYAGAGRWQKRVAAGGPPQDQFSLYVVACR